LRQDFKGLQYYTKLLGSDDDDLKRIGSGMNDWFCKQIVTSNCDIDPDTQEPSKRCTRLFSQHEEGDYCRTWYQNKLSQSEKDSYMSNICTNNPRLTECRCLRRGDDKEYKATIKVNPINDACFFGPCKDSGRFFVPSDLLRPECNATICQNNIIIDSAGRDINIGENKYKISCSSDNTMKPNIKIDDEDDKDEEEDDDKEQEDDDKDEEEDKNKNLIYYIIASSVGFLLLILILFFALR